MNRHILIPVTAPALLIGLLLCGTCLVSAWYIRRLQRDMSALVSANVAGLQAAQEPQIRVRQLRFPCFVYLADPRAEQLAPGEVATSLSSRRSRSLARRALRPDRMPRPARPGPGWLRWLHGDALRRLLGLPGELTLLALARGGRPLPHPAEVQPSSVGRPARSSPGKAGR